MDLKASLVISWMLAAGISSAANAQFFPTNSNLRIQIGPNDYNPPTGVTNSPWFIEDYIEEMTMPNDITFINPFGNSFFNQALLNISQFID